MMSRKQPNLISIALGFGALWGITEATLGYLIHLGVRVIPVPGLAGFVMFPVALFFTFSAYRASGDMRAIPLTALSAGAIKLSSALHPAIAPLFVVNPAIAIIAEGAVLWVAACLLSRLPAVLVIPAAAVAWRLLFLAAVIILPVQKGILMKGSAALSAFLLYEGLVSGLFATAVLALVQKRPKERRRLSLRPALTLLLVPVAAAAQLTAGLF